MKSNYKPVGKFIQEAKVRNVKSENLNLLGINVNKYYIPSVANVIGTDLSVYKIVKKNQFACNRMHVGRDFRLPIALSNNENDFIVSPAYDVFEIKDINVLAPEYLMMWFTRGEFDRNAWFYTDSDVRGGLSWKDFCNMQLPIPSIAKQKEIVVEYHTIQNRIDLNNRLIQKLEETAQAIYKNWFVDFEFTDENGQPYKSAGGEMVDSELGEIPVGWIVVTVKNFCKEMKSGGTPSRDNLQFWNSRDIPWIKTGEVKNNILISSEEFISNEGLKNSSAKLLPKDSVLMSMYGVNAGEIGILKFESTTNQACCGMICYNQQQSAYLYFHLLYNQEFISSQSIGAAQENLSKDYVEKILLLKPVKSILDRNDLKIIIDNTENITRKNTLLENLKSLLLSKLSTIEN